MAILKKCCCWKSVRSGSFASGIYTMIFHTILLAYGAFHVDPVLNNNELFAFGLVTLLLSGMCVMSSALLLVGLCADNRSLLLPWIVSIATTTVLYLFFCLYFILDENLGPYIALFFLTDLVICGLNVYCLLCVVSQYQEYRAGRGRPEDCLSIESPVMTRSMKFHWPSFQVLNTAVLDLNAAAEVNEEEGPHEEQPRKNLSNRLTVPSFHGAKGNSPLSLDTADNSGSCSRLIPNISEINSFKDFPLPIATK